MNIAYLTTQYPCVSHTFIRREILELERKGHTIHRFSIRKSAGCIDNIDILEEEKTFECLGQSKVSLLINVLVIFITSPVLWLKGLGVAFDFNKRSERGLITHLAYLVEACTLVRETKKRKIKHIHVHFGTNSTTVAYLVKQLSNVSFSFTVHGPDEFDAAIGFSLREKIIESSFVVAISNFGAAQLKRWVPLEYWKKILVIGCIVDDEFSGDEVPVSIEEQSQTIVCVARLAPQKGLLILLDALKILKDRHALIVHLVLAGDGELRPIIEQKIQELGLTEQVIITGWINGEQVKKYMLASRALVLPSFAEGLPVAIMESFILKRPVITTMIAGIPELVKHHENGWLIEANNTQDLVDAIRELFDASEFRLNEMGLRGHEAVIQRHSVLSEVPKLEKALYSAIGNN